MRLLTTAFLFLLPILSLTAGVQTETTSPFEAHRFEIQSASGAFFSTGGNNRPTLNYWSANYRLGLMLNSPNPEHNWSGNWEALLQLFGGTVFDGAGNALGGAAVLMRYNLLPAHSKWVPYLQAGVGVVYSDIYKDHSQRLIGQAWEIDLEAALGLRYMLNDRWSLSVEGGFRHISNADMNERNVGLNSLGALLGIGFHF